MASFAILIVIDILRHATSWAALEMPKGGGSAHLGRSLKNKPLCRACTCGLSRSISKPISHELSFLLSPRPLTSICRGGSPGVIQAPEVQGNENCGLRRAQERVPYHARRTQCCVACSLKSLVGREIRLENIRELLDDRLPRADAHKPCPCFCGK